MDGHVLVSTSTTAITALPHAEGEPSSHATRGDLALWEARQAGIPLELTLVDGEVVLRATRRDGTRLRLAGPAEGLADLVHEMAGRFGVRLTARERGFAAARQGDC